MNLEKVISEIVTEVVKRMRLSTAFEGTVKSVDTAAFTCTVEAGGLEYEDVRLAATVAEHASYLVPEPKVGSTVLVGTLENQETELYIIQTSAIERVVAQVGDHRLELSSSGLIFNGGKNEGLPNIKVLKEDWEKSRLTMLGIMNAFDSWVVVPSDGGAALKAAYTNFVQTPGHQPGTLRGIEDTKVKH